MLLIDIYPFPRGESDYSDQMASTQPYILDYNSRYPDHDGVLCWRAVHPILGGIYKYRDEGPSGPFLYLDRND
jgi:hypothetical protein